MAFGPSTGARGSGMDRDTQVVTEALRESERRLLEGLREDFTGAVDDPQSVSGALESLGDRFSDLGKRITTVPDVLTRHRREALVQFGVQLQDLRQDLRAYTLMMGVAVVLIVMLLVVLLVFKRT